MTNFLKIVLILVCCVTSVTAQEKDEEQQKRAKPLEEFAFANVSYTNYGESEFIKNNQSGKVAFSEVKVSLTYPTLLKNKKTVLINGIEFTNLKPTFSGEINDSPVSRDFYSIAYNLAMVNPLGTKGWSYTLGLKPTLASDFEEKLSSEDFILQVLAMFSKRANENFKYGFGISYNTRFGKKQVIPLLQLIYKKNKWETYAYLPAYVGQFYHFKTSKIGLSVSVNGNNYNFSNTNIATTGLDLDKLMYSRINIGPEYEIKLMKKLKLNLSGGIAVANKLDWLNGEGDSELDLSPENKAFFKVGLKFVK